MKTVRFINSLSITVLVVSGLLSACGDGGKAAREKARQDSIRIADSIARLEAEAKRIQDSLNALPKPIAQTALQNPRLSKLVAALQTAELASTLEAEEKNYTVFAPTDSAIQAAGIDQLINAANKERLQKILKVHIVENNLPAANLKDGMKLRTIAGYEIAVSAKRGKIFIDGKEIIQPDIKASNGVIHVINGVMKPKMRLQ